MTVGGSRGSVLLLALVAVLFAATLALSLATRVRAAHASAEAAARRRDSVAACRSAIALFAAERLATDTNGCDHLAEKWAEPWERRDEGWVMRVSGSGFGAGGRADGLIDEASRIPVSGAFIPALAALLHDVGSLGETEARSVAERMTNGAPYACVSELASLDGLGDTAYGRINGLVTVEALSAVNINTAPRQVVEALLHGVEPPDPPAAQSLAGRIMDFRSAGNFFSSAVPRDVAKDLGGLPADETRLLSRASERIAVGSDVFSGVAEAADAASWEAGRPTIRVRFTIDRRDFSLLRWVEE